MLGLLFAAAIRVACIGDSITQGIGTPQSADKSFPESYPAQLGKLLGPGYEVENWGVGGRTLIRKSDKIDYGRALKGDPDVVVICAGTTTRTTTHRTTRRWYASSSRVRRVRG